MCVVNGGQGVSILSGSVAAAVILKNRCMANSKEKPLCRHSRAGGAVIPAQAGTVIPAQAGILSFPRRRESIFVGAETYRENLIYWKCLR
ncbi:hypothetical protein EZZ76_01955 [Neisseria meningitidis]|nr:hypothetical protein [Neisseria meningitidis]